MKDSRFQPISSEEVSRLECGVSLLTNFERAAHYQDWEVNTYIYEDTCDRLWGVKLLYTYVLPPLKELVRCCRVLVGMLFHCV